MSANTALQEAGELLPKMTKSEKTQLLQWVISDLTNEYPGIEKTPGVCGGDARIGSTRIPVWLLIRQWQLGITEERQLSGYPSLRKEDLNNAWNYYRANKEEIEQQIRENEED
jgi:uncharacterized protein (DUF433 family)